MKPTDLRGILQYIPRFREQIIVICADGAVVSDINFTNLILDIAVLRSLNIRVVLVHGAGKQIQQQAAKNGLTPSNLDGTGITDDVTLELSVTAANRLTHDILEGLSARDLRAACANTIIARPKGIINGTDQEHTGCIERVDISTLKTLLAEDIIPVIPPLGFNSGGETFRINSDAVALETAKALGAIKLIFATTVDGLLINGTLIREISSIDLKKALEESNFDAKQSSKAQHAIAACITGVPRVHIINGRVPEGILAEVFSNEGIGTLIYANEYQQIRPATKKDTPSIFNLTRDAMDNDELLHRTCETIERNIGNYYIFDIDNNPVACIALREYPAESTAELIHLHVNPSHMNQRIGQKLTQFIIDCASERKFKRLIALSTQTFAYFQTKAGFDEGTLEDLPAMRRKEYENNGRNSKILIKHLTY